MEKQLILVFSLFVVVIGDNYENKLTKLWSMSSASRSDGPRTAVLNVTSASIVIEPTRYGTEEQKSETAARQPKVQYRTPPKRFGFKPRAIPLMRQREQVERSIHYTQDDIPNMQRKSEILLPGNYFPISEVKRKDNLSDETYNPLDGTPFHPKIIPLMRNQEFRRRSLDVEEEPIIEKPDGYAEPTAMRRSISYLLGDDDEDDEEGDEEIEIGEDGKQARKKKIKIKKKYAKYMLPLLLAYKLKFITLIPLMIGGLVLLVGATGMAGFFFALFAAVMGLQKGNY